MIQNPKLGNILCLCLALGGALLPFGTARAGLWGWAKTAAQEVIDDGITLNLACPGLHRTQRVQDADLTGRMGDPADFGRVVAFLCSEPAGFISGAALQIDGASTLGLL